MSSLFELRGIRAGFDGRTAVDVRFLSIAEGQVTVFMGENGSGKTTLLRILNGLMTPGEGTLLYRGSPVAGEALADVRSQTVLVHQFPLMFRGSVGFNVGYGLRFKGFARADMRRRTADALRRVGLAGFEGRRASALSGGETQRVALARALALEPRVLLLDEPTANVDIASRRGIEGIIRGAQRSGATVIMSTNDSELAYRMCDRLIRLAAGVPMEVEENILKGRVDATDEQFAYFRTGGVVMRCPARPGDFVVAVLPFDELVLSREPLSSSARNQLRGTITSVRGSEGLLTATIDCGVPLTAVLTREAAGEIGVEPGAPCVVTFKASAVRLH